MSIDDDKRIEGHEAVSRTYRDAQSPDDQPPAAIDDAIRAAARRAVAAGPVPVGKSWLRRWTPQLAVAATVVLSVSVIFVAIDERPELAPPQVAEIAQHKVIATPDAKEARTAPLESTAGAVDSLRPWEKQATGGRRDNAAASEAPPSTVQADRQTSEPPAALLKEKKVERAFDLNAPTAGMAAAPAPASPAPPMPTPMAAAAPPTPQVVVSQTSPAAPPVAAASPVPQRAAPAPVLESFANTASKAVAADAARTDALAGAAPAKPAAAAAVPAPAAAAVVMPSASIAPGTATGAIAAQKSIAGARTQEAGGARAFADAPSVTRAENQAAKANEENPADWLKRMRELRTQGKLKELREELARFNKRYPHVVLPKELQDLPPE